MSGRNQKKPPVPAQLLAREDRAKGSERGGLRGVRGGHRVWRNIIQTEALIATECIRIGWDEGQGEQGQVIRDEKGDETLYMSGAERALFACVCARSCCIHEEHDQ